MNKIVYESQEKKELLSIYRYDIKKSHWAKKGTLQKRNESTLIINDDDMKKLFEDVDDFVESIETYRECGIPYKRNYLFCGKPGTGKTSLVNVLANKTMRSIYTVSFGSNFTDADLISACDSINDKAAILVFEDIDCVINNRNINAINNNINLATFLNILDGLHVSNENGLIIIITTNFVEKLDTAMTRAGRIDMILEFKSMTDNQIIKLIDLYHNKFNIVLDSEIINEVIKISKRIDLSPSAFVGFIFRNRKKINKDNYIQIFKKYIKELNIPLNKDDNSNMYL